MAFYIHETYLIMFVCMFIQCMGIIEPEKNIFESKAFFHHVPHILLMPLIWLIS